MTAAIGGARKLVSSALNHPLGGRHPVRTLARIFRWQIESRLSPGLHDKPWVNGARLLVRRGMTGATGNIYFGLHEFADMGFLLHFLRPGDLFLDIGANIGSYTLLASKAVGAKAMAFEPHPQTADWLEDNVRHNGIQDRVTVHRLALSDRCGAGALTDGVDTTNHVVEPGEGDSRAVSLATLDSIVAGSHPVMLKIDVEGHEPQVIAGASATLADPALLAIVIETLTPEIEAILRDNGFVEHAYDPFARALSAPPGKYRSANRLYLRDPAAVARRVASAPRFEVAGFTL